MSIGAADVRNWISGFADVVGVERAQLVALDTAIGDGDHGTNMNRGMQAALEKLGDVPEDGDIATLLKTVGMALVSKVGGAAGPLYGTLFLKMSQASAGKEELDLAGWADALDAGVQGVQQRGKAQPGDKTMLDTLLPAVEALKAAGAEGASLEDGLSRSEEAARQGMEATIPLQALKGRASYLGERSIGHQDPGATSSYLLIRAAHSSFGG
jgi:phosphoenolpyruvate---glycerone phosphotransferase subunit DhaL